MKDYRLSEIVAHCEKTGGDCELCESKRNRKKKGVVKND